MSNSSVNHHIQIVFCYPCGYTQRAVKLAGNILEEFGDYVPGGVTLTPGDGGVFDVFVDGDRIFSKKAVERHAEEREIEDQLIPLLEG